MSARTLGATALTLFLLVALAVVLGTTRAIDQAVLQGLRLPGQLRTPVGPPWLPAAARTMTIGGILPVRATIAFLVAGALVWRGAPRSAAVLLGALVGEVLLVELIKAAIARPRPPLGDALVVAHGFSFPSAHAAGTMLLFPLIGWLTARRAGRSVGRACAVAGVGLAVIVGLTRIFLGAHWTSDVIAGWLLGGALACGFAAAARSPAG